jgi:hypothetical protein
MLPVPLVVMGMLPDVATGNDDEPKLEMLTEVALSVSQYKVVDPPAATLAGLALKDTTVGNDPAAGGGAGGGVEMDATATDVVAVAEFAPLKASSVYVVVVPGYTVWLPLTATLPIPLILAVVALEVFHVSVEAPPALTLAGLA